MLWAAPFRYKVFRTTKRHSPSVFRKQKCCHKATLFCRRAFLLPAFFLPLLKQPFPLFRLVRCLDLGQQEPGEALQLLLGYAVLLILGDAAACVVFFSCRSSVAAPFCRAAPCCLMMRSVIDPDPWPAGGAADGSAAFPPAGVGRCPAQTPAPVPVPPAWLRGRAGFR